VQDNTACLWDADTLELLKTYRTERPVNSASISPIFEQVKINSKFFISVLRIRDVYPGS
jgi:hypothetical protein